MNQIAIKRFILGISAFYHDSAAALVYGGRVVAAAQEERFSRVKHDAAFPSQAVEYCLREAGIGPEAVDYVVFYDKPLLKFERLIETYIATAPRGLRSFLTAMPQWLRTKLHLPRAIKSAMRGCYRRRVAFTGHHESHAACAFYPSPYAEAAILTMDGVGEWETASIGMGSGNCVRMLETLHFPHSPGLLYSAFTYFCGFKVNSGEYKLMGLAPYGEPRFVEVILRELIDLKEDGSFRLNMRYFDYAHGLRMTGRGFEKLFGGPARRPEEPILQREMDLAASVQRVTEEIVLRMARHAKERTGCRNLVLGGGVALNCVANGVLARSGLFEGVWIPAAAGDAGGALGAALFVAHQLLGEPRMVRPDDALEGALLGPSFGDEEIRTWLVEEGIAHTHYAEEAALLDEVSKALAEGKVVGWFHGRMEFGPRALGGRSILGDAGDMGMQSRMNLRIKFRESFRPFAPSVLAADAALWFELEGESPYMLMVAPVRAEHRLKLTAEQVATMASSPDLMQRVNIPRSTLPAVTHVDYSARIQTVTEARNGRYARLIKAFKARTGRGVLVNTSFNVRGEPIVCTPQDAWRCFMACDMDVLVLENCILQKSAQPVLPKAERERYLSRFTPD